MRVVLLGTGTSQGIPVIGCDCSVCKSDDLHNKRTRTSALISYQGRNIVIDTATEFRIQMVDNSIRRLDAVLFTHAHADHIHGLDDIRQFNEIQSVKIPCFGNKETLDVIEYKYDYVFKPTQQGGGKPDISLNRILSEFELFGMKIVPLPVKHGILDIFGYRVGNFAYITDASHIPLKTLNLIGELDVLVINALRYEPHSTHFSVHDSLDIIGQVKPKKAYLTHISHRLEHQETEDKLPDNVHMGYDGLTLEISD
jgi:phosphoribosyl 1,2-cyclic phosphate phosphodiesterase